MGFESFLNWQNDLHWGPFEFLRPPKDADIGRRLWLRVCAWGVSLSAAGILLAVPVVLTLVPEYLFYRDYHRFPSPALLWRVAEHVVRAIWWLVIVAPCAFPLLWRPYVVSWNRRAARLRRQANDGPRAEVLTDVWPPAPVRE